LVAFSSARTEMVPMVIFIPQRVKIMRESLRRREAGTH
jgi:hypothetical protein